MILTIETLDFIPQNQNHSWKLQTEDCESDFIEFIVSPESLKLCLDNIGLVREKRSQLDLEKTKYSLVANTSNYFGGHFGEMVSSGNKLAVRFFSKQGKLPGLGFKAKFKIGKTHF